MNQFKYHSLSSVRIIGNFLNEVRNLKQKQITLFFGILSVRKIILKVQRKIQQFE